MLKEYGGLGVPNLRDLNVCLLATWIKRYNLGCDKLWRQFLDFKYKTDLISSIVPLLVLLSFLKG
jgi:hypothetical protein